MHKKTRYARNIWGAWPLSSLLATPMDRSKEPNQWSFLLLRRVNSGEVWQPLRSPQQDFHYIQYSAVLVFILSSFGLFLASDLGTQCGSNVVNFRHSVQHEILNSLSRPVKGSANVANAILPIFIEQSYVARRQSYAFSEVVTNKREEKLIDLCVRIRKTIGLAIQVYE